MTEDQAEKANLVFVHALKTGRGPDAFLWGAIPRGFASIPSKSAMRSASQRTASEIKASNAEKYRTDRDACPKCGVRRDIGCQHSMSAAEYHRIYRLPAQLEAARRKVEALEREAERRGMFDLLRGGSKG